MSNRDDRIRREQMRLARSGCPGASSSAAPARCSAALAVAPALLAACGGSDSSEWRERRSGGGGSKSVAISNWTSYMDPALKKPSRRTPASTLTYDEDINSNNEYFAKIRPNLSKDQSIGKRRVRPHRLDGEPADQPGEVGRAVRRGEVPEQGEPAAPGAEVAELRPDPQVQRAVGERRHRHRVQHRDHQEGDQDDRRVPRGRGHDDGPRRDARHRRPLHAVARASTPTKPTYAEAGPRSTSSRPRSTTTRSTAPTATSTSNDLGNGNLAAAFAWSGDVAQITKDNPDVRFAVPDSGGMLWSDNFMIPYTTDKADLASEFINYFYDPKNAAILTDVHPVHLAGRRGRRPSSRKMGGDAAKLVDNPLVNPTDEFLETLRDLRAARPRRRGEVRQAVRGDHRLGLIAWPSGTTKGGSRRVGRRGCCSGPGCSSCSSSSSFRSTRCSGCRCRPSPTRFSDPVFGWEWGNYSNAFSQYGDQFLPVVRVRARSRRCSRSSSPTRSRT